MLDEGVMKFLFNALKTDNSVLSLKLMNELKMQLNKRRNKSTVSLLKFLQDPKNLLEKDDEDEFFKSTSKLDIIKDAKAYMWRLFKGSYTNDIVLEPRS